MDEVLQKIQARYPALRLGVFAKGTHADVKSCAAEMGHAQVVALHQVHGNVVRIVENNATYEGDGCITTQENLALSIRFADCQAFAIYAPKQSILGVIHAGWRGMAQNIIPAFYDLLLSRFSVQSNETVAYATASLCLQCAEFSDPHHELPAHLHPFISEKHVDLRSAADMEFAARGVHIERCSACTRCDDAYCSHRRGDTCRNYLVAALTSQQP